MRRRAFDVLTSAVGLLLAVVLLVAGGLLMWGYSYDHSNVHNQLAQQDIFFPAKSALRAPDPSGSPVWQPQNGHAQSRAQMAAAPHDLGKPGS